MDTKRHNDPDILESALDEIRHQGDLLGPSPEAMARTRAAISAAGQKKSGLRLAERIRHMRSLKKTLVAASVAAILLIVGSIAWFGRGDNHTVNEPQAWFSLLSQACAAENAAFRANGIVHIKNEIVVQPMTLGGKAGDSTSKPLDDYTWVPICSLQADGQLGIHQLRLAQTRNAVTVEDTAWYDPASGRFARVVKTGDAVIFANSFDGSSVYTYKPAPDGVLRLTQAATTKSFKAPKEPAAFLGISAGMPVSLDKQDSFVQAVSDGKLVDGSAARVYKAGIPGPQGTVEAYWLFKVKVSDSTLAEKEFWVGEHMQLSARRVLTEPVQQPEVSWTLSELKEPKPASQASATATISSDMVITDVSVEHMVKQAEFETYTLASTPGWTAKGRITDVLDVASPPQRMFMHTWRAEDGRHVVMLQSAMCSRLFTEVLQKDTPVYTSPKGCKLYCNEEKGKWLAEILLRSAQYEIKDRPSDKRTGVLVMTPAGTVIELAVNGTVSDDELHSFVDALVPARDVK